VTTRAVRPGFTVPIDAPVDAIVTASNVARTVVASTTEVVST
jgi:hypothetical protein